MTITFVSSAEQRTWLRLLELDGPVCRRRAPRRQSSAQRRKAASVPDVGR